MTAIPVRLPLSFGMTIEPLLLLIAMLIVAIFMGRNAKKRLPRLLSWLVWALLELGTVVLWIWLVYYHHLFLGM